MIVVTAGGKPVEKQLKNLCARHVIIKEDGDLQRGDILICAKESGQKILISSNENAGLFAQRNGIDVIISAGAGGRCTITPSSTMDGGMATLQRELKSIGGSRIPPMEVDLSKISGTINEKMCIAAALLVIDENCQKMP